jgi:hypothetical protein
MSAPISRWLAVACLSLAACRGSSTLSTRASEPAPPSTAALGNGLTEDALLRYVRAETEILERSKTFARESQADAALAARPRRAKPDAEDNKRTERRRAFDTDVKRFRDASGLDDATWGELDKLFDAVMMGRMAWRQSGGDEAIAGLEKEIKAELDKIPEEHRAQSASQLGHLLDGPRGLRDGAEARKRWGDRAVDLVLKHGAEIESLRQELFQLALQPAKRPAAAPSRASP